MDMEQWVQLWRGSVIRRCGLIDIVKPMPASKSTSHIPGTPKQ